MGDEGPTERDRRSLVLRSMQFFRDDDITLREIANARGVSKSDIVRGMIALALDNLPRLSESSRANHGCDRLGEYIEAGRLPSAKPHSMR